MTKIYLVKPGNTKTSRKTKIVYKAVVRTDRKKITKVGVKHQPINQSIVNLHSKFPKQL